MSDNDQRWTWYRKRGEWAMRPYEPGEDLSGVEIPAGHNPSRGDWIVRELDAPGGLDLISAAEHDRHFVPADRGLTAPPRRESTDKRGAPAWWKDGKPAEPDKR